jgi:hypothetical protein
MEFTHDKFGKCVLKSLTQKMLEDFHLDMVGKEKGPLSVWRGDSVRVFVKHEFMLEPKWTVEDVNNANPGHIVWLSDCIGKLIAEAMHLDPLS